MSDYACALSLWSSRLRSVSLFATVNLFGEDYGVKHILWWLGGCFS